MSNLKVPYVFTHKCFKYEINDLQKQSFMTECTYCSRPLLANKSDGWSGLYTHLKSKVHKNNVQLIRQQQMSQFEIENDHIDDDDSNSSVNDTHHDFNDSKTKELKFMDNLSTQDNFSLNNQDLDELKLKIKLKEDKLMQIQRENDIYKGSIDYMNRIKQINEEEIENLRNKILSSSNVMINYDLNELNIKIKQCEDENKSLKEQNLKVEQNIDYLRFETTNIDSDIQNITKENLQLNIQINDFNELVDMLKKDFGLSTSINDLDCFEQELIKHFEIISNENKSLKDKLVENLINM